MEIETKTASLETFSVTIRALHVNGKQMTLAVFRQLPEGERQEGDIPWGTVRYSIKNEGDLWLVFSRDGKLYRRTFQSQPDPQYRSWRRETLREIAKEKARWSTPPRPDDEWSKQKYAEHLETLKELSVDLEEIEDMLEEKEALAIMERDLLAALPQLFIAV